MILNTGKKQNSFPQRQRAALNNKHNVTPPSPAFKGMTAITNGTHNLFSLIQTHEIAGPTIVNLFSMVIPRSLIDFTRSNEAGIETARRETTSLVSSSIMPGFYALGAGWLMSKFGVFKGVKGTVPVNNSTMNYLKEAWDTTSNKNTSPRNIHKYVKNFLGNAEKLVDGKYVALTEGVSDKEFEKISGKITTYIHDHLRDHVKKDALKNVTKEAVDVFKAEQAIKIGKGGLETSISQLINGGKDMFVEVFSKSNADEILKKSKKICRYRTAAGLGIASTIAIGTQYVNRYLTKMKTGSDAFVGLPDYATRKDTGKKKGIDLKLIGAKTASVATMWGILGASLSKEVRPKKIFKFFAEDSSKFLRQMQFKGKFPSLNQLALLSATTYSGRMLASHDMNELRETNIRDMFGFLNWLVFGGFVTKLTANKISETEILREKEKFKGGNWLEHKKHVIKNTFLLSASEIEATYGKKASKYLWQRNVAIGAGILYSTVVLGAAIPLFNKYVTNKIVSKKIKEQNFDNNKAFVETTFGDKNNNLLSHKYDFSLVQKHSKKLVYSDFMQHKQKYVKS